jgi:hypothetical protein
VADYHGLIVEPLELTVKIYSRKTCLPYETIELYVNY